MEKKVQTERKREMSEQGSKGSKRKLIIDQFREAVSTATFTWHRIWGQAAVWKGREVIVRIVGNAGALAWRG